MYRFHQSASECTPMQYQIIDQKMRKFSETMSSDVMGWFELVSYNKINKMIKRP